MARSRCCAAFGKPAQAQAGLAKLPLPTCPAKRRGSQLRGAVDVQCVGEEARCLGIAAAVKRLVARFLQIIHRLRRFPAVPPVVRQQRVALAQICAVALLVPLGNGVVQLLSLLEGNSS